MMRTGPRESAGVMRDAPFGIAICVDFTATAQDWAAYLSEWMGK
jgi:hypothetical protein